MDLLVEIITIYNYVFVSTTDTAVCFLGLLLQ